MKNKVLVAALLLTMAVSARAQYSDYYYHRVGDTIEMRSEIGYYAWWNFEYYYENDLPLYFEPNELPYIFAQDPLVYAMDSAVFVQRYYTPTPLRVVGLAGVCMRARGIWPSFGNRDTNEYKDYFVIYDAMPDSFPLVGKTEWSPYDSYRMLHLQYHLIGQGDPYDTTSFLCCRHSPKEIYLPIHEYYFDSAIIVEDSFYVGGTFFGGDTDFTGINDPTLIRTYYWTVSYGDGHEYPCEAVVNYIPGNCTLESGLYKSKYGFTTMAGSPIRTFADAPWVWQDRIFGRHILIYPLVEVDTTVAPSWACLPVDNVQVTSSGRLATVTWDVFPNYSRVRLRYGKAQFPQSQWTEIDVTGNTLYTITDLQPQTRYGVTMKAECDTIKKASPWSEPVTFFSGGNTEGIEGTTLLSQLTFLQPNPTKDEMTVTSSFSLKEIDIWTVDGTMVYHGGCTGHDTKVDVSWLRPGTYIVAIHTHNGTTHKRLVIAR